MKRTNKKRASATKKRTKKNGKKQTRGSHEIWGKFGSVYSPIKQHYVRLGTSTSFNVIKNELSRDKEWTKRVTFMAKRNGKFSDKLKTLLE